MSSEHGLAAALESLDTFRKYVEEALANTRWVIRSHGDHDAIALIWTLMSHAAAVVILGRDSVALVLPATAAARSAYEAAVMAVWLVQPEEPAERDRRWVGLLMDERSFWTVAAREAMQRGDDQSIVSQLQAEVDRLDAMIGHVEPQLESQGVDPPVRPPKMDRLLDEIGRREHYVTHKVASQLVHPSTRSIRQVRDLRDHAAENDFVNFSWRTKPNEWTVAILLSATSLVYSLDVVVPQTKSSVNLDPRRLALLDDVIERVKALSP